MYALAKHKLVTSVSCAMWEAKPDAADICKKDSVCLFNKSSLHRLLLDYHEIWICSSQGAGSLARGFYVKKPAVCAWEKVCYRHDPREFSVLVY